MSDFAVRCPAVSSSDTASVVWLSLTAWLIVSCGISFVSPPSSCATTRSSSEMYSSFASGSAPSGSVSSVSLAFPTGTLSVTYSTSKSSSDSGRTSFCKMSPVSSASRNLLLFLFCASASSRSSSPNIPLLMELSKFAKIFPVWVNICCLISS